MTRPSPLLMTAFLGLAALIVAAATTPIVQLAGSIIA